MIGFSSFSELVQLFEAMAVDDFFELAVVVVVNAGDGTAELQQFTVFLGIGMPSVVPIAVGVACMGKLCPGITHPCGPYLVGING